MAMRAAMGIPILAAGLGLAGVAVTLGTPERAVPGPSVRARPSGAPSKSPPPNRDDGRIVPIASVDGAAESESPRESEAASQVRPPTCRISGRVVDENGTPIPSAELRSMTFG